MNILYVHGIGSNGKGNTVRLMKQYFTEHNVYSFDIPFDPDEAINFIKNKCVELDINVIVGTSLGGFYTMQIHGYQKILINPAIEAFNTVKNIIGMGTHDYLGEREDGIQKYTIDSVFIEKLKDQFNTYSNNMDEELRKETYALFGNNDEVCDFRKEFQDIYGTAQFWTADFGHRLTENIFKNNFIPIFERVEKDFKERVW